MLEKITHLTSPKWALLIAGIVSALLLAGAHAFEKLGNMPPCALCLDQREVHWAALAVFVLGGGVWILSKSDRVLAASLGLLTLVFAYSTLLAGYHAGVEWTFWPGPPTCSGGAGNITVTNPLDLQQQLETAPIASCTDAAWRMFGISMAGYNALVSLGLMGLTGIATYRLLRVSGLLPLARGTRSA